MQEGQHVEEFTPVCEVQSDKASVEITSRFAGTVRKLRHDVGDIVQVLACLAQPLILMLVAILSGRGTYAMAAWDSAKDGT